MTAHLQASEGSRAVKRTIEFIRHHRLQKGDRLPSERELSDRFGVTRSSVREALAVLDALRLTERRPKSGIFLRNALEDSGLDSLVIQANLDLPFDERTMRDVSEARVIFETHAIRLACARRTDADLNRLRELVANYSSRVQAELNVANEDVEFHLAMAAASQNAIIVRTLTPLFLMSFQWRQKYFSSPVIRRRSLADHQEFVATIADRDETRAAALVQKHVHSAFDEVRAMAEGNEQPESHNQWEGREE
jgi:GntR family transcriptional repressor for pyruvate dehydrogenase complex